MIPIPPNEPEISASFGGIGIIFCARPSAPDAARQLRPAFHVLANHSPTCGVPYMSLPAMAHSRSQTACPEILAVQGDRTAPCSPGMPGLVFAGHACWCTSQGGPTGQGGCPTSFFILGPTGTTAGTWAYCGSYSRPGNA